MSGTKIPYIPPVDFEKAKHISESFLKTYGFFSKKLPINVEILANKSGHPVELFPGLEYQHHCKGTAWYNKKFDRFEIYIDDDHYNTQSASASFTIAEELGHIILHASIFKDIKTPKQRLVLDLGMPESTFLYIEQQAKRVASELLLPTEHFYPYVTNWFQNNLKVIKDDRPINEDDLLNLVSRKLCNEIDLSEFIIKKALIRQFSTMLIPSLVKQLDIKYLVYSKKSK